MGSVGRYKSKGAQFRPAAVILSVVAIVFLSGSPVASAHSGEEAYVYLDIFDDSIEGRVEYPASDLGDVLGIEIPQDAESADAVVAENVDSILEYTRAHLAFEQSNQPWDLSFETELEILPLSAGSYVVVRFDVDEDFVEVPRTFTVEFDGIIESKPDKSALFIVGTDWRSGTFNNEAEHLLVFDAQVTSQQVDLGDTSWVRALTGVVGLGVEHIRIGSDHILFILALLLPSVLVFEISVGWRPTKDFGSGLWRIVKIATSFTVAHTITLTLGGLGVVSISPEIVEPVIAISIALAALHNLRPVFVNKEWLLAFVFGLFHGFGFAGLLAELGLDRSNRLFSLLGFNLGIELGQVAIIVLLFPALFLLRRTRIYLGFLWIGSSALIIVALGWFVDRVFGLELGVDRVVDPLLAWPRVLILVAAFTAACFAYYRFERSHDRLIPLGHVQDSEELAVGTAF